MNGGRLSDDETFLLGVEELRLQLQSAAPDFEAAERALTRIGVRFPEEAERLRQQWAQRSPECNPLLAAVEAQYRAEANED